MKIDRYNQTHPSSERRCGFPVRRFTRWGTLPSLVTLVFAAFLPFAPFEAVGNASESAAATQQATSEKKTQNDLPKSHDAAKKLLRRVVFGLASGPAFESKFRQRVWTTGREGIGVGTYEQSGYQTGQFHLQMTMFDGDGKHTLQQISDGRLSWTRTAIADKVTLKRVDVSRLDEWTHPDLPEDQLPLRLRVGGWIEMLESIEQDHQLQVNSATMTGQPVWVITAVMPQSQRDELMKRSGRSEWPELYPAKIRIAISKTGNSKTGFGKFLPVRFEYYSAAPAAETSTTKNNTDHAERLISLVELYAIREITAPPVERFRFENRDVEVNFTNETSRYMKQFGVDEQVQTAELDERRWNTHR
ncbi:hypothetical protein [Novipirellula artificiosorum]|uniref:Uncharacterized protein n=1 Tax=Novipirellula artificiosorum TaxID=2528016 RepID=A0A5C6D8A6_9BACT|nr:hypothetical protein [Novipirellula artificiosorum]TWU33018.1 hypothetical protein Poly41_53970 [Novipirellula artificiosorum]